MKKLLLFAVTLSLALPAIPGQPNWVFFKETPNVATSYYDANSAYYRDGIVQVWFMIKYPRPWTVPILNITEDKIYFRESYPCDKHDYFATQQDDLSYLGDSLVYSDRKPLTRTFAPGSDEDQARDYFCSKFKH